MEVFAQLVREFGPIVIVYLLVFHAGPKMLKDMADVGVNRARIQDRVFEGSVNNVSLLLEQNQKERDRNYETEAAMREAVRFLGQEFDRVVKVVDTLAGQVQSMMGQQQTLSTQQNTIVTRVDNVVIKVDDMDERLGDYVRSTAKSLEKLSNHISKSDLTTQEKSQ